MARLKKKGSSCNTSAFHLASSFWRSAGESGVFLFCWDLVAARCSPSRPAQLLWLALRLPAARAAPRRRLSGYFQMQTVRSAVCAHSVVSDGFQVWCKGTCAIRVSGIAGLTLRFMREYFLEVLRGVFH